MSCTVPVACSERRLALYSTKLGGWIWTKCFILIDHHCCGMGCIFAVKRLLIQIIIIGSDLNKCARLNVGRYYSPKRFNLSKNFLCNTRIHCTHLIVGNTMSHSIQQFDKAFR